MNNASTWTLGFVARIVLPLFGVFAVISLLGGWIFIARRYPDRPFAAERSYAWASGYFGRILGGYRMCISVVMNSFGLRLSIFPLFRFLHPPMVIPWSEIRTCSRARLFGFQSALARWSRPIYLFAFLGKDGYVYEIIIQGWQLHNAPT